MQTQNTAKCGMCGQSLAGDKKPTTLFDWPVHKACGQSFNSKRLSAAVVDVIWSFGILIFVLDPMFGSRISDEPGGQGWLPLAITGLMLLCKDAWSGISPGKLVTGLQVVDADTSEPIGLWRSIPRNLMWLGFLGFAFPESPMTGAVWMAMFATAYRMRLGP